MNNNNLILGVLVFFGMLFSPLVKGQTITIGTQVWMTKNLNVDKFRNGEIIPEAKTAEEWLKAGENKQPAWCYYDNEPSKGEQYGKLYNWYAVNDPRGLAPEGWHVPSAAEWSTLTDYLGGYTVAGKTLKSNSGWAKNGNGTNESGFSGLPCGIRDYNGSFDENDTVGARASWWSSDQFGSKKKKCLNLFYRGGIVGKDEFFNEEGISVRCVKNQ